MLSFVLVMTHFWLLVDLDLVISLMLAAPHGSSKLFCYKRRSHIQWVVTTITTMVKFMILSVFIPTTSDDPITLFEDATCFDPVINFVLWWSF